MKCNLQEMATDLNNPPHHSSSKCMSTAKEKCISHVPKSKGTPGN